MRLTPEREKEIRDLSSIPMNKWANTDAMQMNADISELLSEIDALRESAKSCKHPRCCCVCGHEGKCPEDGPTLI